MYAVLSKMTRWARAGSTRKHKKQPEDPTPWGEFVQEREVKNGREIKKDTNSTSANDKIKKHKKKNKHPKTEDVVIVEDKSEENNEIFEAEENNSIDQLNQKKYQKNKKKYLRNISADDIKVLPSTYLHFSKNKNNSFPDMVENDVLDGSQDTSGNVMDSFSSAERFTLNSPTKSSLRGFHQEKTKFIDRLREGRSKNGMLLLPVKIENKIYKMKKGLRDKGMPGDNIKEIIRKVRRKEELKFRKSLKTCFKCRKVGHVLADCPLLNSSSEDGTGICFKCGSAEHISFKCPVKTSEFSYATCFICKEQGHISRTCPRNERGIYPKGGSCNICGNVNHLKKDCPTLKKRSLEEKEMTLGTLTGKDHVEEMDYNKASFIPKKPNVISF